MLDQETLAAKKLPTLLTCLPFQAFTVSGTKSWRHITVLENEFRTLFGVRCNSRHICEGC
jgi:hypothetical protein